ncbi:unnamed protein product [Camellia sinensis]
MLLLSLLQGFQGQSTHSSVKKSGAPRQIGSSIFFKFWRVSLFLPVIELLKMVTSFAFRNPLKLKVVNNAAVLHFWNMCIIVVRFRSLEKPKEDEFCLELSKLHNYDDVVERVARHLGLDDPSKIRLTSHNCYSQQPKAQPIKYRGVEHLSDMPVHYNQTSDIPYYKVLDIPLLELQGLKTVKVAFHHAIKDEAVIHTMRLPKHSAVGDVINVLKAKLELSHPNAELRLLEVFYHKIYKVLDNVSSCTGKESEESNLLQQLADACLVVDALEPSVREELLQNFCSRELTSYQQIKEEL